MMDEDELDPRIQVELEKLNSATDVINKLEIELDEANTTFRMLLNECTRRLKVHSSKHGSAIENARPYYEALEIARKAQQDCQQAAVNFQRANEVHEAAKETVALAESRFMSQQPEWRFDSAWQEMLNHATIKVRDAEKQRAESSAHHGQATARYKEAQEKVHLLDQRLRRNVAKSRPYFEEKQRCNEQLAAQKEAVETLAAKVAQVKSEYAESLRRLEGISEEIHRKRGDIQTGACGVREPGVGAELVYKGEHSPRETTFAKANYNYDAKSNAADLPDGPQRDANKGASAIHARDAGVGSQDDFGDFRRCADAPVQNPDILNDLCVNSSNIPREINANVRRKISFESLHGSHFNPTKDVQHDEESRVVADSERAIRADPEVVRSEEATSSESQGKFSLSDNHATYGEATQVEQGLGEGSGASDDCSDIKTVGSGFMEHPVCCTDKSAADVSENSCDDQLAALTLDGGNKGAKHKNADVAEVAGETSTAGVVRDGVGAEGDVGATPARSTDEAVIRVADNPHANRMTSLEDSRAAEQKPVTAVVETSSTLFTRPPDLELSFRANKAQLKDNDGDSALNAYASRWDGVRDKEVPTVRPEEASGKQ